MTTCFSAEPRVSRWLMSMRSLGSMTTSCGVLIDDGEGDGNSRRPIRRGRVVGTVRAVRQLQGTGDWARAPYYCECMTRGVPCPRRPGVPRA